MTDFVFRLQNYIPTWMKTWALQLRHWFRFWNNKFKCKKNKVEPFLENRKKDELEKWKRSEYEKNMLAINRFVCFVIFLSMIISDAIIFGIMCS